MTMNMTLFDKYSEPFARPITSSLLDASTILMTNVIDALCTLRSAFVYEEVPGVDRDAMCELLYEINLVEMWLHVVHECIDPSDTHEVMWRLEHPFNDPWTATTALPTIATRGDGR